MRQNSLSSLISFTPCRVPLTAVVYCTSDAPVPTHFPSRRLSCLLSRPHFIPQLAQVARTPWLDPCVAGVILSVKALSEGDGRLGKGALAGWADKGLRAVSDIGAKALRLSSGDEVRDAISNAGKLRVPCFPLI